MDMLRKKSGFAIELSVCFMVIIFLFCSIITSSLTAKKIKSRNQTTTREEFTNLDAVGDAFIASVKQNKTFYTADGEYGDYRVQCYVGARNDGNGGEYTPFDKEYYENRSEAIAGDYLIYYYCLHVYDKNETELNESTLLLDVVFAQVQSSETMMTYKIMNWSDQPLAIESSIFNGDDDGGFDWEDINDSDWENFLNALFDLIKKYFKELLDLISRIVAFLRELFG